MEPVPINNKRDLSGANQMHCIRPSHVEFDVGGQRFKVSRDTISKFPDT